jgi:Cu/Ag efflux protein CusF
VTNLKLGSMGKPLPVELGSETVFICCQGCEKRLKELPQKYLDMLAPPPEDEVLTIPQEAVIDTGSRQIVYVEREPGVFEGVKVVLGPRSGEHYPVLSGLIPGEKIAAAGAFLIDAETRLNPGAASSYFGATGGPQSGSTTRGTQRADEHQDMPHEEPEKKYEVKGQITAIGQDGRSVTLDHEAIPGLMPAMEMKFQIGDSQILKGIEPGLRVSGQLSVQKGKYTITSLKKVKQDQSQEQ